MTCKTCNHSHIDLPCSCGCVDYAHQALREVTKPRYSDIPLEALLEQALIYSQGSMNYNNGVGNENWKQGLNLQDVFNHAVEHMYHWQKTYNTEHHGCDICSDEFKDTPVRELAKVIWACNTIIWYYYNQREMYEHGRKS